MIIQLIWLIPRLAAAPYVHHIKGAIFIKVCSMATAARLLMTAIDDDAVDYIA